MGDFCWILELDMDVHNIASVEDARELLRSWREDVVRRSEDVISIWEEILCDAHADLSDERWMILEQVAVAAMDVYRRDIVTDCLKQLRSHFDRDSFRLRRLEAMRAEMLEDWELALEILDQILEEDDSNSQARKRKIAIHRARGENAKAITALNKYLDEFMCDGEAWMELCEIYILEQEYTKAAFCCEELILQNPHNHLYYQKYAEIKYTQGGFENMELAKTYYCHTIKINPNNMRALYGLLLTSSQLLSSPKCTTQKKKDYQKSVNWAAKQISSKYETKLEAKSVGGGADSQVPVGLLDGLIGQLQ